MDQASATRSKKKATLRLQMQALLLLSFVLMLLLLSFGDSKDAQVASVSHDSDRNDLATLNDLRAQQIQADHTDEIDDSKMENGSDSSVSDLNSQLSTSQLTTSQSDARLDSSSQRGPSQRRGMESRFADSSNEQADEAAEAQISEEDEGASTGSERAIDFSLSSESSEGSKDTLINVGSDLPVRQIRDSLLLEHEEGLSKAWGRSLGERVTQSALPLSALGKLIRGDNDDGYSIAEGSTVGAEENPLTLSDDPIPTVETSQSIGITLKRVGFVLPQSRVVSVEPSDPGRLLDSTNGEQGLEGGLASGSNSNLYEPIVQPPAGGVSQAAGFANRRPSAEIAMTQLQSPVPGTAGPLAPSPPLGPGNGPAINFPSAPNQPAAPNQVAPNQAGPSSPAATGGSSGVMAPAPNSSNSNATSGNTAGGSNPQASTGSASSGSTPPEESESQTESNEASEEESAEEPTENAMDPDSSEKHMISELVGSGYGWFGSVFDSGFYFANEFTFLAPKTVGTVRVGVTDMLEETTISEDTDASLGFGNRLTLGVRGSNAGLQCQYWTFATDHVVSESWQQSRPIPRFITSSAAALETVDLEITQQHTLFGCQLESSFGGRYAEYDGQESAGVVDELHDSLELSGLARATRHLRGAGPTLGLSGRKNLRIGFGKNAGELLPEMDCESCGLETCCGDCGSWRTAHPCFPWNVYWNGRIAWLWADESAGTVTEATVNYDGGDGGASTARSRDKSVIFDDSDSSIFTLGFQVGLEYTRPLFTRSQLMARVGYEYQHWDLGKNVAEAQSFAFLTDNTNFGGRVDALASSNRNYLKLSGFTLLIGLNY